MSCSWPIELAVVDPGCVTLMVPSPEMVIAVAFDGIETGGSIGRPSLVVSRPCASIWSDPARVYARSPLACRTAKKPLPSIARSSGLFVCCSVPCEKERVVAMMRTPVPSCVFVGATWPLEFGAAERSFW